MIFIDKMKNFKIYKTQTFLPTLVDDKKKGSAILLMTPNYNSSKKIITNPLFVNKLRYMSYYIKRDVSYYINSKKAKEVNSNIEESVDSDYLLKYISESSLNLGDKIVLFNEDANDSQLFKMIYNNRLRQRKDVLALYDQVKTDIPFIKYTFPELNKYQSKNVFVDLYFYNKVFFENNTWTLNKGLNLYLTYMTRLLNDPELKQNGYNNKTIMIPISDWSTDPMIWNYKKDLNPMSIIYFLMNSGSLSKLKSVFGDTNILFIGNNKYFKVNFSDIEEADAKKLSMKFKLFLIKIVKNEEFELTDIDTTSDNADSSDVIKANIIDKIELAKGVDITASVAAVSKNNIDKINKVENKDNISKLTLNKNVDYEREKQEKLIKLAQAIATVSDNSNTEDDAWDDLDNEEIKKIIMDLDSSSEDKPDITAGRSTRMNDLQKELLDKEIKGKSIRDILEPAEPSTIPVTNLDVSTPNDDWKELKFSNFDKNYDIDRDIIRCFKHFENVSRPIAIRNLKVEDNSTSEDRLALYTAEMEDYTGARFTVKLDIPVMVDNRFLLRGSNKSIQTQLFNMPIIKTEADTCQIISNYMKIFVRKFGDVAGKSLPSVAKFMKAAKKYNGRKIKFELGDNTKICRKYNYLPMDYTDLAKVYSRINIDNKYIIYFNQDEIRDNYNITEESIGVPYIYDLMNKKVLFYNLDDSSTIINNIISIIEECNIEEFIDLFNSSSAPTVCSYSRCSIMNSQIPLIVICAYHEGLRKTLDKAKIKYTIEKSITKEIRNNRNLDWIKFSDGYVVYEVNYESSLLMNGLKNCSTDIYELSNIDNKNMYLEFLDSFGGRIKADGLENFYDLELDPMIKDSLEFYKFPTDYVSVLLYANALLADNKFIKHTDTSSRRLRRYMLIAVYTYKVLADAYAEYANMLKHNRRGAVLSVKQSAVIDKFLTDTITSEDSVINALQCIETTNSVTTKGPSGMNTDRAYSIDKRTYDESMLNVIGMSTGFAANVGITRQATIDSNVDENGYVVPINGDTSKMNTAKSLTMTEALTPFGTTHDDPIRTAMTFIQTAKHSVRTEDSDPLLVTNGADEAMPYLTSDKFAFKAKSDGVIKEINDNYIIIEYDNGKSEYINLTETIEHNSDGGYYVPLKLDSVKGLKVGSKVKTNQIVAYDKYSFSNSLGESDNLAYNIGKLSKVAIINSDEGFEDSGVITEKLAQKLATRIDLQYSCTLDKNTNVQYMAKVGDKVECRDSLVVWQSPFDDEDANRLMQSLAGDDVNELGKKKLVSEVTGVVKGIKIFRTVEIDDLSDSLKKIVTEYEAPLIELEKKLKENNIDISQVPAHYILPPTGKLKKAYDSVVIEYYIEYRDAVGIGDKVVYNAANKAVEKSMIPLGKEPYTEFRPNETIDAFVSEVSIDKRMVTSTIIYGSLQKLMIELDRSVKDIMGVPYDDSTV